MDPMEGGSDETYTYGYVSDESCDGYVGEWKDEETGTPRTFGTSPNVCKGIGRS